MQHFSIHSMPPQLASPETPSSFVAMQLIRVVREPAGPPFSLSGFLVSQQLQTISDCQLLALQNATRAIMWMKTSQTCLLKSALTIEWNTMKYPQSSSRSFHDQILLATQIPAGNSAPWHTRQPAFLWPPVVADWSGDLPRKIKKKLIRIYMGVTINGGTPSYHPF